MALQSLFIRGWKQLSAYYLMALQSLFIRGWKQLSAYQACLEEIVKGIRHCKTNITHCNLPNNEFVLRDGD